MPVINKKPLERWQKSFRKYNPEYKHNKKIIMKSKNKIKNSCITGNIINLLKKRIQQNKVN